MKKINLSITEFRDIEKLVDYFSYHNKNLTILQDTHIDKLRDIYKKHKDRYIRIVESEE